MADDRHSFFHRLKIGRVIGIYHWKRKIRQTISLDAEMADNLSQTAKSDNIDDAQGDADLWPALAPNMPKRELFPCCAGQCNVYVAPQ